MYILNNHAASTCIHTSNKNKQIARDLEFRPIAHKYVTQYSKSNLQNHLDKLIIQNIVQIFEVLSRETFSLSKIEKNVFSQCCVLADNLLTQRH